MWGFTRQEQRAVLFLLSTFAAGSLVWLYRQSQPPPAVKTADIAVFEEYAGVLDRDSIDAGPEIGKRKSPEKLPLPPINLNTATYEDLLRLPGIGPVMAKRILEYRRANGPFKRVEELRNIKGIGAKSYEKLAPLLVIK
jgi:competence protein ComEA